MVGTCSDRPCSMKEKCTPTKPYSCKAYCGDPKEILYALVDEGESVQGSLRKYTCMGMHFPSSNNTLVTCQTNSEWSGIKFHCIADCGDPKEIPHALVDEGETVQGSVRKYTCTGTHVPNSDNTLVTCQTNSEWSEAKFQCIAQCGAPPAVASANVLPGLETENAIRTYTCLEPYTASTHTLVMCQPDSKWTPPLFYCKFITTCDELRTCNPGYSDGEYWLILPSISTERRVKITCSEMNVEPKASITFNTPSYSRLMETNGAVHEVYYYSVGISYDSATLTQGRFTTSPGLTNCTDFFGTIWSQLGCEVYQFSMTISLENTGLRLYTDPAWVATPYMNSIDTTVLKHLKHYSVTGTMTGFGDVNPGHDFALQLDPDEVLPVTNATLPACV